MKVFAVLLLVTATLAAPQVADVEEEAEFVPGKRVPGNEDGGDGVVFVVPGWNPLRHFFRNIFSRHPGNTESEGGLVFDTNPEQEGNGRGGFFSIIDSLFRLVPSPSENATVTFQNSTVEVVSIGGVPMLVNRTIVEHTNDNGSVFRRVDQRIVGPYENSTSDAVPPAEDDLNELEIQTSTTLNHHLKKRWIVSWLKDTFKKRQTAPGPKYNHLPGTEYLGNDEEEERTPEISNNLVPIRNEDDIAVNYLMADSLHHNPDAEVFDPELMREAERTFWERRGNSEVSQPLRTQPMMSQPLRSQPMMSQPLRSQPMMSQPLRSQPMMSQPLRSQPMMSQPLRSQPMMSQPLRSQPMMSRPLRTQPIMSQPLRSQPIMSRPLRTQPIMTQPLRSEPIMSRPEITRSVRV